MAERIGKLEMLPAAACDGLGRERPWIRMVVLAMRRNLREIPALVGLAHRWSIDTIFVQHLCHDFGESSLPAHYRPMREFVQMETLLEEDHERIEQYFTEATARTAELGVDLWLPSNPVLSIPERSETEESKSDVPW